MRSTQTTTVKSRSRWLAVTASVAVTLLALPGVAEAGKPAPPPTGTPTSYAGRAYALDAQVNVLGAIGVHVGPISDTGELPATGGMLDNSFISLQTAYPLAAQIGILNAATVGSGHSTISWASTVAANIDVAGLVQLEASVLEATSKVSCANGVATATGTSTIADLVIKAAGVTIPVALGVAPNTTINVLNIAVVTVNEQYVENGRLIVNAVHVRLNALVANADVVISHAEAGIGCGTAPPECSVKDFVTGGGFITLPSGEKGTFGMVGGQKANGLQGHFTYIDHGTGQKLTGTAVTAYASGATATERKVTYSGDVDGTPASILATVSDNGEPGGGVDGFKVSSAPYSASGPTITKGNIQLHQPSGCASTTKPGGKPK
jgi:hypothetical protein